MEVTADTRTDVTVVSISGTVDSGTAGSLSASLRAHAESGGSHLVADLARVDYMSSAGLRALLETVKEARQRGGDLRLASVQPNVLRVLDLSGFTKILKVFPDVDAAAASFVA
jgi:anti-sigma B factor antagonist